MPIYEYECPGCSERFEKLVKMNAPDPACPGCGGQEVRKLISAAAFVLKGGGWYKDHYGLKSTPTSSSGSDGGGGSASSGSSASSGGTTTSGTTATAK